MKKINTIDVIALEWRDKINGNSYFAGTVTVNFALPDERTYYMPFQYGYGDHYQDMAFALLREVGEITDMKRHENGMWTSRWEWAKENGVIVRYTKHEKCKNSELKPFTKLAEQAKKEAQKSISQTFTPDQI